MNFEHMSLTAILRQKPIPEVETLKPQQDLLNVSKSKLVAKNEYRAGDWICNVCNNHNYSFRNICNRCNSQTKENNLREMLMSCNNENVSPNTVYPAELAHKPDIMMDGAHLKLKGESMGSRMPFQEIRAFTNKEKPKAHDGLFSCFDKLIVNSDDEESEYEVNINSKFFDFMNYEC